MSVVRRYAEATAAVSAATGVAWAMFGLLEPATLVMTYLLAIVVAAVRCGRGPSVLAALASVAAFDFFFVPPHLTFAISDTQSLFTFAVMLVVGLTISGLTDLVRRQAHAAREREQRTSALYAMSRALGETSAGGELVTIAARHVADVFGAEVAIALADAPGRLPPPERSGALPWGADDLAARQAAFEGRRPAGLGTSLSPRARALYLPLLGQDRPLGVVGVLPARRGALALPEARRQLETFVNQTALAVERARLADEAREAEVRAETERLRNSLLSSVSHDLRTPLATITGAASTLLESGARLDDRTRRELLESVREEGERLNRLVQNLLEMTRLESGALELKRDWHSLEEVIGAALARVAKTLGDRRVTARVPPDLPLVPMDDVLVEQVLVNLLDNAVKYTPAGSPIDVIATATDTAATVEVADRGPGLPRGEEDRVFEKFYRGGAPNGRGAGLGLAICHGIVKAHGGRIWAQNLPEGGVAFLFTLPITGTPPAATDG